MDPANVGVMALALWIGGCDQGATPAASPTATVTPTVTAPASATAPAPASVTPTASATTTPTASATAMASASAAAPADPPLLDDAGALLPQTEAEPSDDSPLFQYRLRLLFDAIVHDDPERALSFFFPRAAYEKVKAIAKPGRDWDKRLWKSFVRDVHDYHEQLGPDPDKASFVGFEPRSERKKWMKPNSEGNSIGYWRMTRNKLTFRDAAGKERSFEITGLISWRGEWHLVHLHNFK